MYAVIKLQGHQYIVQKGDSIVVDQVDAKEGDTLNIKDVLVVFDEKGTKVNLGDPFVKGAEVVCAVSAFQKGDKITVLKFKRKNRYQRTMGFRAKQTVLEIKEIKVHE